jgi:UDP-N-acetylglucosamine--N-acetylmuramyl-(pentapeptide) pyrophosphoryl-undecaprenol N-acetylglucosamine transferase
MNKSEVFKINFAGGATGGHLAPGIALAEDFLLEAPCEIEFLIVGRKVEELMLDKKHFNYKKINAAPFRKTFKGAVKFLLKNITGVIVSLVKFIFNRPNAMICLGGYGAFPPAVAAKILRIPIFILEQNAIPGKVNRFLSRWAK